MDIHQPSVFFRWDTSCLGFLYLKTSNGRALDKYSETIEEAATQKTK